MSNNSRVVAAGDGGYGEIGSAQYFQALAAGVVPTVDMNPVLLKPERDTGSQVVAHGRVETSLSRQPWRERSAALAAVARESFERLADGHELLVIEGAGSPAEINLAAHDYFNLGAARWAQEKGKLHALLVADIDRGGALAHLHGTCALLPADLRGDLRGFILNKFRGDAALLAPGPQMLQQLTGVPVAGVIPMQRDHGLPDEDGLYVTNPGDSGPRIAIIAWPHVSNLDEFHPLARASRVRWVREPAQIETADIVILPGSKQVSGDLAWLHTSGLAPAVRRHATAGKPLLGICGGLQVLGQILDDPEGLDGDPHGPISGLGLLPLSTCYAAPKRVVAAPVQFLNLAPPWDALSGLVVPAYEIRNGITAPTCVTPHASEVLRDSSGRGIGWQSGAVLGVYAHGLFERAPVMHALFGACVPTLDASLDALADLIERHIDAGTLAALGI